jgi:hypothetical protein
MCNFLIGGKTGASRLLAVHVFDHNALRPQPSPVRHFDSTRRASLVQDRHLIHVTTSNCTPNERISHGHCSNAKSL